MITLTTEQAQQIEEALESVHGLSGINMSNPLSTIRAAIAQEKAEQEPVAWIEKLKLAEKAIESIKSAAIHRGAWSKTTEKCDEAMAHISAAVARYQEDSNSCAYMAGYSEAFEKYAAPQPVWSAEECDRVVKMLRYIQGIAERGEGRAMREDETLELFVLNYVKRLEQAPQPSQGPVPDFPEPFSKAN